ncbi:MAG: mechanosensitive ion channel family protein [Oscillospiraceae bacterium]|nr:mechanosensitive ion channel family protein [Oscillospiraceae bacterium]
MDAIIENLNRSNLIASILVVATVGLILHALDKIYTSLSSRPGVNKGEKGTAIQVTYSLIRLVLIAGCIFSVLQINGIDVSSMLAGVGLVSAFIGLAAQDFLKDIVMGTRMLTDRFFEVGDVVQYGSFEGVVESFDIRCTKIRGLSDGRILTVCNRNISEISAYPKEMGSAVTVLIPISEDPAKIEKAFKRAIDRITEDKDVISAKYLGLTSLTGKMGNYSLLVRTSAEKRLSAKGKALPILVEELRKDDLLPH